jgi:hypothetical protein
MAATPRGDRAAKDDEPMGAAFNAPQPPHRVFRSLEIPGCVCCGERSARGENALHEREGGRGNKKAPPLGRGLISGAVSYVASRSVWSGQRIDQATDV